MRFALLAITLASATASIVFACTGENRTGFAADDAGDAAVDAGEDAQGEDDEPVDSGEKRAPNGCLLKSTDYTKGAKAESVPRTDIIGAVEWTNVAGALAEDGQYASVTLDDGQESADLRISDFQLNVPDKAETWGIEVQLKRRAPDGGIEDVKVNLAMEGKEPRYKWLKGPWPKSIVGTHYYGQAIDTWGVDLFPADVDKPTFAATLRVHKQEDAGPGPVTALVDSMKVAVYYDVQPCPPP